MIRDIRPERCHDKLRDNIQPILSFNENKSYELWKEQLKDKFYFLNGLYDIEKNACPLDFMIEEEKKKDGYTQIRFSIESEWGSIVPVYVLIPDGVKDKAPVCITLQGHSTGFHNSIGEPKEDDDKLYGTIPNGGGIFAWQAVQHGYIAVAIEQRGMGERRPMRFSYPSGQMCSVTALGAFEMGRTVLGERMWDVSKVIDVLDNFPQCDLNDITITGSSGGGTMSFYAACYDERIKVSAPCCAFSPYKTSIMQMFHCACNYIPFALKYFEMQDLAALIAPRKLCVITGKEDRIFPIEGVREGFKVVKQIYKKVGCEDNCMIEELNAGHSWGHEVVWNGIKQLRMKK